jgi:hypothetical protein
VVTLKTLTDDAAWFARASQTISFETYRAAVVSKDQRARQRICDAINARKGGK